MIIPPRQSDLQETSTTQALSSIPATTRAEDVPPVSTTATDPQHAEEVEYTMDKVLEAAERAEKETEAQHDSGEDLMADKDAGEEEKIVEEDDDTGKDLDTAMEVDLNMTVDGGTGGKPDVTVTEGETPVKNAEGATHGSVVSGRETLANVEEADPVQIVSEGETPVLEDERETPGKVVEGETTDIAEEATSGGLQEIVDLVNEPEGDETPLDERLVRIRTRRRSLLDEVDEPTGAGELNLDGQGAEAGDEALDLTAAEEKRLAAERKSKGKHEAQDFPEKTKKNPAAEPKKKLMADAIKVPFAKSSESPAFESETEKESEQEEVPNFERVEVRITKKLLESMEKFDDSKRAQTHKVRSAAGKLVKSGQML